jgi:hypothetical protein
MENAPVSGHFFLPAIRNKARRQAAEKRLEISNSRESTKERNI